MCELFVGSAPRPCSTVAEWIIRQARAMLHMQPAGFERADRLSQNLSLDAGLKSAPASPSPPHQTRPSCQPYRTFRRLHGCKCYALVLSVPVASDAPAPSGARASARRPRLARPKNDGGNNASADNQRTDAPDAYRALRSRSSDHKRAAEISLRDTIGDLPRPLFHRQTELLQQLRRRRP
jgi:hypothetical protein